MKKFVIVCSAVMIALLCVSGITVLALSPETDTADEGAQSQPESALPAEETEPEAGDVADEATSENPVHDLAEIQEPTNEELVDEEDSQAENCSERYIHHLECQNWIPASEISDSAEVVVYSFVETNRESYPSMDELRSISDMKFYDQVEERFGKPDEQVIVACGVQRYGGKYYADNGEYVFVCFELIEYSNTECCFPICHVSFSDVSDDWFFAEIVTNEK